MLVNLSQSALQALAIVDGAGEPLEPTVIAERRLVTTGSMTSLLATSRSATCSGASLTPMTAALGPSEQRSLLKSLAKLQQAALRARAEPGPDGALRRRPTGTSVTSHHKGA